MDKDGQANALIHEDCSDMTLHCWIVKNNHHVQT